MHRILLPFPALAACAFLCAGCNNDTPAPTAAAGETPATKPNAAGDDDESVADAASVEDANKQTADMTRAVSAGKATAPVDLKFTVTSKPVLGAPVAIDLAVISLASAESMTLSVQGGDGIDVDSATSLESFQKSPPGSLHHHKLRVTPRAEGAFNVAVLVTMVVPGSGLQSRTFAIPLLVGGLAALEKSGAGPTAGTE
ncbi:MAG TPA: hypothetical protein VE046_00875 [Steroidobacteraceae bacterium]|nr:hypothetical protein [Steroidobacteraceae bacterium]